MSVSFSTPPPIGTEWLEIADRDLRGLPYEQFLRDLAERGGKRGS